MAVVSNANPKRMYSWWWDSHISPKNSKWLQENLTDMDSKVKQMIKVIEEDADTFARRAEMYYKKRPELMKLVEEFYRAYRALAERYDHATGVIRHAHRTFTEAFPNQMSLVFGDGSPADASINELDPRTPEMPPPVWAPLDQDELQKDVSGVSSSHLHAVKRNGAFTEEPESMSNRKGLKQLNDLLGSGTGRARKSLKFNDGDEKGRNDHSNTSHELEAQILSESERVSKAEAEIAALKEALAKVQAEKEASLTQYQQNMERLSNLDSVVSRAQEDSKALNERAISAEAEVQTLKEALSRLESEKESSLLQYQQCQQKIADLEDSISQSQKDAGEISERAGKAEAETQALKQTLARAETEKGAALVQYQQCLETISNLEERLRKAEEDARIIIERAGKVECEVENLKQTISKLTEEKEASALQYQECLDTIADLKLKLFHAQEEIQRLNREMEDGVAKLKVAEEKCVVLERSNQNLHSELDTLLEKLGDQSQELTEKQKEVGRLWTCVQEERLRFLEAETAFQTLQQLHSQSQEELRSLALELQTRTQILKDMEIHNDSLQEEVQKAKDENKGLNELNLSSAASIQSLQEEISNLRDTIQKLEAEVQLRVDQRNALQQEIYCLKEELNQIGKKHQAILEQVEFVGLDPDCLSSSVKELQDENSKLKESSEREKCEKMALLEKLEIMEKLAEKNLLLENSISELNSELEAIRGKLKTLEEAFQSLSEEKSGLVSEKEILISRLQTATESSEKLFEKNRLLDNSLSDANAELDSLRLKLKSLEESCHLLNNDKSSLTSEKESLVSQMDFMRKSLEDLETGNAELKMKVLTLETEREYFLQTIEELGVSLHAKDREYATFVRSSEARMGDMKLKIHHLQDENHCKEREYQGELDRGFDAQIEIFVLQKCIQDLLEKNSTLSVENQNIKESSRTSEKLVSELEHESAGKQIQIDSLISRIKMLRMGLHRVLRRLETIPDIESEDESSQDEKIMRDTLSRVDEMQNTLLEVQDENQHSAVENNVLIALLQQLKSEIEGIATEKSNLEEEFKFQNQQLSSLQSEAQQFIDMNKELISKLKHGDQREETLKVAKENLHRQVLDLQGAYSNLEEVNQKTLDENRFLKNSTMLLEEEKRRLEKDIAFLLSETIYQGSLILVYEDIILEKQSEVKRLSEDLGRLHLIRDEVDDKLRDMESQNSQLIGLLEKSEDELLSVRSTNEQLGHEITNAKDCLDQKEKELQEAVLMISMVQNENTKLSQTVEELEYKHNEAKAIQEEQEKCILRLRGDYDEQIKQTGHASEVNRKLAAELQSKLEELDERKVEKEKLNNELLKERSELELWESQARAFFGDMQTSAVREALLEGMARGLAEDYQRLESESASKDVEIEQLKGKVNSLEDTNQEQKAHMKKYAEAVYLLAESVGSLEDQVGMHHKSEVQPIEGAHSVTYQGAERCPTREDCLSELHDMRLRIKAIDEAVMEKEKLAMLENLNSYSKLEAAMKQIEELKAGARTSKRRQDRDGKPQKQTREISSEENEVITKDIMLDQVSDGSSYGRSRRGTLESDDQRFELWETHGQGNSLDLRLQKPHKMVGSNTVGTVKEKGKSLSEESLIIDKLEISNRFMDPNQEVNKKKVLERLDSDLQKLANLQITVQDLKNRVEVDDKSKKGKGDEYETIKGQLEEAEEAIGKLFSVNRKLTTKAEKGFTQSEGNENSTDMDEAQSNRGRRISEQARKGSEKIGRLQLEVQRIQFLLLKLQGEKESRSRTKIIDSKARVLLRDYIYGGRRGGQKKTKKKSAFCACVQPHSP